MGKHTLKITTAMAICAMAIGIEAAPLKAQARTPEQTAAGSNVIPGEFSFSDGQAELGWFESEMKTLQNARQAQDCDLWNQSLRKARNGLRLMRGDGDLPPSTISELSEGLAAESAKGCTPKFDEPAPEGLAIQSVVDIASPQGVDLDFEVAQVQGLAQACRDSDGSDEEIDILNKQKDNYGRHYREVEAAMNEYRELAMTTDDPALENTYLDNFRKYEKALEGMPKPWEFPCGANNDPRQFTKPVNIADLLAEYGYSSIPQTGIGFQRAGAPGTAPEEHALTTPNDLDYLGFRAKGEFGQYTAGGFYFSGDGVVAALIEQGTGVDAGIVYGALSPGGSSGIAAPFSLESSIEVDVENYGFSGGVTVYDITRKNSFDADMLRNRIHLQKAGISADYEHTDRRYYSTANGSGNQGGFAFEYGQIRDQKITEDRYGLTAEAEFLLPLSARTALRSTLSAGGYYRDTSLDSLETNQNNFTGAPDSSFTVDIIRDDDGFGFQGGADLFFDINLSPGDNPGPVLSIGGGVEYRSSTGAIFNPNSGDQVFFDGLTTDLITGETFRWFAGLGLRIPL